MGIVTFVRLPQELNAWSPIEVTPLSMVTDTILVLKSYHGTSDLEEKSSIAPSPEMVRLPLSVSTQVTFSPQLPLSAALEIIENAESRENRMHNNTVNFKSFFILILLQNLTYH